MSNMKHDAIVEQGIPIHERIPIPDEMIPADSRVEIDAKIQAGYCKCLFDVDVVGHVRKYLLTWIAQSQPVMLCRWMSWQT